MKSKTLAVYAPTGVAALNRPDLEPHRGPSWCARGHQCGLGEHRARPVTLVEKNRGVSVLTRVQAADGRQHVEVRIRITLARGETNSRAHLALILSALEALLKRVTRFS